MRTEGAGKIEFLFDNNKSIEVENVIYVEDLSENLFSLRKFAEMGLSIYLDSKEINIFDPVSNESFITGVYNKPHWIIELKINKNQTLNRNSSVSRKIFANLISNRSDTCNETRYKTRSVTAKELVEKNDNSIACEQARDEDEHNNKDSSVNVSNNDKGDELLVDKLQVESNDGIMEYRKLESRIEGEKKFMYESSNFDTSHYGEI